MNQVELKKIWLQEEEASFKGWDFSRLKGRIIETKLPWSYKNLIDIYLQPTHTLLDMGTGGGEFLLSLKHPYNQTSVTEGYIPNYELCLKTLDPLGITVKHIENDLIDYPDNYFEVVINRHESFDLNEVKRVLKTGGIFITQQVGKKNNIDISSKLGCVRHDTTKNPFNKMIQTAQDLEFELLEQDTSLLPQRYLDVGAFVYFAKIISWEFPGFSVNQHYKYLCDLQELININGYFESTEHRYLLVLKKN